MVQHLCYGTYRYKLLRRTQSLHILMKSLYTESRKSLLIKEVRKLKRYTIASTDEEMLSVCDSFVELLRLGKSTCIS